MRTLSVICDAGDVAVVPFPFSERPGTKRRPALVLSSRTFNQAGHTVFAMITTQGHDPWPGDVELRRHEQAGLQRPCIVRPKLFTLDNRLVLRRTGALAAGDRQAVRTALHGVLGLLAAA
jgi:mRNA interferase MazF